VIKGAAPNRDKTNEERRPFAFEGKVNEMTVELK
jgi:hypothetical protein